MNRGDPWQSVRLSETVKEQLKEVAVKEGRTVSALIRDLIMTHIAEFQQKESDPPEQ